MNTYFFYIFTLLVSLKNSFIFYILRKVIHKSCEFPKNINITEFSFCSILNSVQNLSFDFLLAFKMNYYLTDFMMLSISNVFVTTPTPPGTGVIA